MATPPAEPPGTTLPPGTASYWNTWNATTPVCPVARTNQPLVPITGWNKTLAIPTQLFNGSPDPGTPTVTQNFSVYPNGTFSVSDDHGNSFSLSVPTVLPGPTSTTLVGNSTMAVAETKIRAGSLTLADVKVIYSVYDRLCQPAGVRLVIKGTASWGSAGQGPAKITFSRGATSYSAYRAWFGNSSGLALGFDWSDSKGLNPSFDAKAHSLTYSVGSSFDIDPVTVTTTKGGDTTDTLEQKICYASGLYWFWYYDGTNIVYRTSASGLTWSAATVVRGGGSSMMAIYCSGTAVYYAIGWMSGGMTIFYRYGTMNADGSISWAVAEGSFGLHNQGGLAYVTTVVDKGGSWWVGARTYDSRGYPYEEVWKCPTPSSCSWSEKEEISGATTDIYFAGAVLSLTSGVAVVYSDKNAPVNVMTSGDGGTTWTSAISTTHAYKPATGMQFASIGNTVYGFGSSDSSGGSYLLAYAYGGGSWAETMVGTGTYWMTPISTDGAATLVAFEADSPSCSPCTSDIYYYVSSNLGASWGQRQTLSNETDILQDSVTAGPIVSGNVPLAWTAGDTSPLNVRFAIFPAEIPTAATSSDPWSRAGVSPYESYFSEFSDYVSPGNGLVSVEAGTLDLPGRGLGFAPSLVYSEPYAFATSPPTVESSGGASCPSSTRCSISSLILTQAPDLLYVTVQAGGGASVSGITSTPSLTWYERASVTLPSSQGSTCTSAAPCVEQTWYAIDQSPFSGSIKVTLTGSADSTVAALGIVGAGTAPNLAFDVGRSAPCVGTATSSEPSCSLSTVGPSELVVGAEADNAGQYCTAGSPFAKTGSWGKTYYTDVCLEEYQANAPQSGLAVSVAAPACTTTSVCAIIGDAISGSQVYEYDGYPWANVGLGWSLNLPWLGTDYLHLSDGQAFPYSWVGNTFQYNGPANFVLTKNTGGTYTLNMSSGTLYRFDTSKKLTSITDRTGNNAITFSYGSNGYISQATDTVGRTITFSYNANNQLTSFSEGGRTWTLGYTGSQLTSLTDPMSRVTGFQYNGTTGLASWLLTAVLWPTGGKVVYTYGSAPVGTEASTYYATSRNVYYDPTHISESQSISYAIVNGQVTWSNSTISDGTTTRSYLDYNFQPTKDLMKTYSYDGTKTLQSVAETDSDAAGRTNATKVYSAGGTLLAESTYAYDNWGNLIFSKDDLGQQEWFSYANTNSADSLGSSGCSTGFYTQTISSNIHDLPLGSCDYQNGSGSPQQETFYKYDTAGNLLETKVSHDGGWLYTDHTYDQYGNVLSTTDADGHATYYRYSTTYDSAYLTKESALAGSQNVTTTYAYDLATGHMLSQTDPNGYTTSYQYDVLGRQTSVTHPEVNGVAATAYTYYYDGNNTMKTVDPDGHVTLAYFDGLARETEAQAMNGTSAFSTVYYTYNWCDSVATKFTATGNTYAYSYDYQCRLTKLTNPDGTYETTTYNVAANTKTVTDEDGHQTVYQYDWGGKLTSVKEYNSTSSYYLTTYSYDLSGNTLVVTDAKNQQTAYQYDDLNRLTQTTFPTSPLTYETKTYDDVGNLLTRTTANGSTITYTYDALNRLAQVSYPGSGGTVTYNYDADGNRLAQVSPAASDYYSYDARGRLANQTEVVAGTKITTLYAYDNAGNVVQTTYPDGYVLSMGYDGVGWLKTVGSYASISYTPDGQISKIAYGDGEVATYTYNSRDRPTQILDMYGTTKELDLNYTYDGTGNVLTENTQTYGYDALNRLTSATGPWGTVSYTYDQVGNRARMVNGSTTTLYTYGAFNRLTGAGGTTYSYNSNGDLASRNGTAWTYSYDYENRLTAALHSGTVVQQNYYDGDGNRVKQVAGGNTFVYSYQGVNILYQRNVTSGAVTKSFYAGGIQVAKMVGGSTFYLHQDALGSIVLTMTSTVTPSFKAEYIPYGPSYGVTGSEAFQYTGKLLDEATGLYYEGARYYDPSTGRFVTEDSVVGTGDDPQSLNRYVYARGNPMKIVDMAGHEWWDPVADISAAVNTVVGEAANVNNAMSNWWNSMPPDQKVGIIVLASAVAIAATAGVGSGAVAAIDAGTIGSIVATGAATVGFPAIALAVDDSADLDASSLASVSQGVRQWSQWPYNNLSGLLAERVDNLKYGDINNGIDAKNAGMAITFRVPGGNVEPDGVEIGGVNPPIVNQVKVGYWSNTLEAQKYVDLIDTGQASPGRFSFYQSPLTGKIGTTNSIWSVLGDRGYQDVYTRGLWWKQPW